MKIANVFMEKMAQHYNWAEGAGQPWIVHTETFTIKFDDSNDFRQKLAEWTSNRFDVAESDFVTYVSNEIENNRFGYNQTENGYLADYTFWVNEVYEETEFTFEEYGF